MAENEERLSKLKKDLKQKLPANDIGLAEDFLEMKLVHETNSVTLLQIKYVHDLVRTLHPNNCKPAVVPCE